MTPRWTSLTAKPATSTPALDFDSRSDAGSSCCRVRRDTEPAPTVWNRAWRRLLFGRGGCGEPRGAVTWLGGRGDVVGVSNHTHFLRAVRQGRLRVVAVPVERRHGSQLWSASVQLATGDTVAAGTVAFRSVVSASSLGSTPTEP